MAAVGKSLFPCCAPGYVHGEAKTDRCAMIPRESLNVESLSRVFMGSDSDALVFMAPLGRTPQSLRPETCFSGEQRSFLEEKIL